MTVKVIAAALLAGASVLPHAQSATPVASTSPAKKELVQKLLVLQQPAIDNIARGLVERPIVQMTQEVRLALQQVPADRREAVAKSIDADIKTYIGEATPLVSERATKLAPSTIGTILEGQVHRRRVEAAGHLVRVTGEQEIHPARRRDAGQLHAARADRIGTGGRSETANPVQEGSCRSRRAATVGRCWRLGSQGLRQVGTRPPASLIRPSVPGSIRLKSFE